MDHGWICRWAPHLVESDLALDDLAAAREHGQRAAARAPMTGMAGARAAAARAQALVALAEGDAADAAELALAAAAQADAAGAALEAARDRLVAGRALLATDPEAAIALLTAAGEQATLRRPARGRRGAPGAAPAGCAWAWRRPRPGYRGLDATERNRESRAGPETGRRETTASAGAPRSCRSRRRRPPD